MWSGVHISLPLLHSLSNEILESILISASPAPLQNVSGFFLLQFNSAMLVSTCRFIIDVSLCQPHFSAVSSLWAALEAEMLILSMLTNLLPSLRPFLSAPSLLSPERMELLLHGLQVPTDTHRSTATTGGTHTHTHTTACWAAVVQLEDWGGDRSCFTLISEHRNREVFSRILDSDPSIAAFWSQMFLDHGRSHRKW